MRALSSVDDKRFLLADSNNSLAYGHRDIPTNNQDVELVGDNAVLMGREEAEARGIRIGMARDPTTTMVRPPGDVAPETQRSTGAASSSATKGAASGEAASSTSVWGTGDRSASIT